MIAIRNGKYVRITATPAIFVRCPLSAYLRNFIDPEMSRHDHNKAVDVLWKRIEDSLEKNTT